MQVRTRQRLAGFFSVLVSTLACHQTSSAVRGYESAAADSQHLTFDDPVSLEEIRLDSRMLPVFWVPFGGTDRSASGVFSLGTGPDASLWRAYSAHTMLKMISIAKRDMYSLKDPMTKVPLTSGAIAVTVGSLADPVYLRKSPKPNCVCFTSDPTFTEPVIQELYYDSDSDRGVFGNYHYPQGDKGGPVGVGLEVEYGKAGGLMAYHMTNHTMDGEAYRATDDGTIIEGRYPGRTLSCSPIPQRGGVRHSLPVAKKSGR